MDQEAKATRRRYREGTEYFYDFAFLSEVRNSRILNEDYQVGELDDLLEIKEKRLQMLEEELEDVDTVQKRSKQIAFNKGQTYVQDDRSREKKVTLEAKIDVVKWEMEAIKQAIEEAEKEKVKHDEQPCLPRGPEGCNQVRGTTGSGYVDGQWVEPVNGVPVIVDERSRYRGMAVVDYIQQIARPWIIACSQYKAKCLKEGKEVHHGPGRGSHHVPWPEWPVNLKKHPYGRASVQRTSTPKLIRTK